MIYFKKRDIGCWRDENNKLIEPSCIEFKNETDLFNYVIEKLPWVNKLPLNILYPLRIENGYLMSMSPLGTIIIK